MRLEDRDAVETRVIEAGHILRERYVLLERLGDSAVYKALDRYRSALPEAQRCVALKILHSGDACSDQTIADLRRELHPAQTLSHRNIVNVHELDRDAEVVFFTMELLDGELLSTVLERIRPTGMQARQAWQFIRQLGAGLEHAHERGVVHGNLSPRNIYITRDGELRILKFGSATDPATAGYASCEQLAGRPAEPADDLYALACICVELLTGSHPFGSRPATLARDFGVLAVRPTGLGRRQWTALQRGLSWHRGGRSISVGAWMRQLVNESAESRGLTPLREVASANTARTRIPSRAGVGVIAALLISAVCMPRLWSSSAPKAADAAAPAAPEAGVKPADDFAVRQDEVAVPQGEPVAKGFLATEPAAATAVPKDTVDNARAASTGRTGSLRVSAETRPVRSGDRFVEVRVRRNHALKNTTFTWWTETATAKQGVDFEPQSEAIQTFPEGGRSTRFYVKLLPNPERSQRGYFYVAIAQPGHHQSSGRVTRVQVWLPRSLDLLQARR